MTIIERLGLLIRIPGTSRARAEEQIVPRTILVVDDDPIGARAIEQTLQHAGFRVVLTSSVNELLHWLCERKTRFELLLLNPAVPKTGEYGLIETVRRLRGGALPIVALSDRADNTTMLRCYKEGADYFLPKPFPLRRLLSVVRYLTASATNQVQRDRLVINL